MQPNAAALVTSLKLLEAQFPWVVMLGRQSDHNTTRWKCCDQPEDMGGTTSRADAKPSPIHAEADVADDCWRNPSGQPVQMYSRSQGSARSTPLIPASTLPWAYMEDVYIVAMQGGCHEEGAAGVKLKRQ